MFHWSFVINSYEDVINKNTDLLLKFKIKCEFFLAYQVFINNQNVLKL